MSNYYYNDGKGPLRALIFWIVAAVIFAVYAVVASSCSPTKRIGGLAAKHPQAAKEVFVAMFPPRIETVTNTQYLPGKIDTLPGEVRYVDCDSVKPSSNKLDGKSNRIVRVPCPPSTRVVDTLYRNTVNTVTNTAKEQLLEKETSELKADNDRLKKGRSTWRWVALAGIVLLLGGTALKIFTKRLG